MKQLLFLFTLVLPGTLAGQFIPNGGFEYWEVRDGQLMPKEWKAETANPAQEPVILPCEYAHDGALGLRLETIETAGEEIAWGTLHIRAALDGKPRSLTGYHKAQLRGDSRPGIRLSLRSRGIEIGRGELELTGSVYEFRKFEIPIDYFQDLEPDSVMITVSSALNEPVYPGAVYWLDGLIFVPTSLLQFTAIKTRILPNPVVNRMLVEIPPEAGEVVFVIRDGSGEVITTEVFVEQTYIDVTPFAMGTYFYEIRKRNGKYLDGGRFQISR